MVLVRFMQCELLSELSQVSSRLNRIGVAHTCRLIRSDLTRFLGLRNFPDQNLKLALSAVELLCSPVFFKRLAGPRC